MCQSPGPQQQLLPTCTKFFYGMGSASESMDRFVAGFEFFFWNQIIGLDASRVGLVLLLATLSDAIADPTIGSLSDRCLNCPRFGRRHQFMLGAALPAAVSLVLVYNPPAAVEAAGTDALWLWFLIMCIVQRVTLSLFGVPHLALGAEMTDDYLERSRVTAWNQVCGGLARVPMQAFAWFIVFPSCVPRCALAHLSFPLPRIEPLIPACPLCTKLTHPRTPHAAAIHSDSETGRRTLRSSSSVPSPLSLPCSSLRWARGIASPTCANRPQMARPPHRCASHVI